MRSTRTLAAAALVLAAALLSGSCRKRDGLSRNPSAGAPVVFFFDVGQGDSALIQTPEGQNILFDTGPNGSIVRLLQQHGIRQLDLLVLSHPHRDHDGGLRGLAKAVSISKVWYSGLDARHWHDRDLRNLEVETVRDGSSASFGALHLKVLHPGDGMSGHDEVNNNSLVIRADYNGASYLLPGDCELGCWEDLFRNHRSELRSDVLKAAHHGSGNGTNSGVLINVRPRVVVISCGRDNKFGHPAPIVLRMVEKLGAQLYRTDQIGTIRCAGIVCASEPSAGL